MTEESSSRAEARPQRHRISVENYHRMSELGLLGPDAPLELIEGTIFDLAPASHAHRTMVRQLEARLRAAVLGQASILHRAPILLAEDSEAAPDLAVLRAGRDSAHPRQPSAADALLLIEVSEATWHYDRDTKVPLYGRHGIPEVWLIDLTSATLHFFRALTGGHYTEESVTEHPGVTFLPGLMDVAVDLEGLFPGA
ncbi:MAG: Uma2 family endonuclease [Steroidobacteraceae bacterium]